MDSGCANNYKTWTEITKIDSKHKTMNFVK